MLKSLFKVVSVLVAAVSMGSLAMADVVETKNGARLTGTVTKVDAGVITLVTDYAGTLSIKQSEVVNFETSQPLFIRLSGGTTMEGTVSATPDGKVVVNGKDGTITTTVDKVATTWSPGQTDPAVASLMRKWAFEIAFDLAGKTGNSEKLGFGGGAKATLEGPEDALKFYTSSAYQRTNGLRSEDKFLAGVDYASYLSTKTTWYTRDEGGYDNVKGIEFYNVAAAGFGYDMIKNMPKQKLTGRAGLSYRFEDYGAVLTSVRSAGLDLGLDHHYRFETSVMNNTITFVPSFDDFTNYRLVHDSNLEFPLAGQWKFRVGVNNDFNSVPAPGVEKLDTTYYGKFVLKFE